MPTRNKVKRSKARNIGGGCKLFYNGAETRKHGLGIVVREELAESVLEVKMVSLVNGHETEGKKVDTKHSKCICSTC